MRMQKKADLPSKICHHCGRPFNWRKKWEKVWDEVKYCSDACRRSTKGLATPKTENAAHGVKQGSA